MTGPRPSTPAPSTAESHARRLGPWPRIGVAAVLWCLAASAQAGSDWASCPEPPAAEAAALDGLLRLAAQVQEALQASGDAVALVSRSGLDLRRVGHATSHAGLVSPRPGSGTWQVRQLYYDCAQGRPRVFDQGLPGFVAGVSGRLPPRVSVVWWPAEAVPALAAALRDDAAALALVGPRYRAQAHAWSLDFQNCNQWVAELIASAHAGARGRAAAQQWLAAHGYRPSEIRLPHALWLWAAALLPHMGLEGHPQSDLEGLTFRVSMPASLEAFIRGHWPQARRIEWCWRGDHTVMRRGWEPLDEACEGRPDDERRFEAPERATLNPPATPPRSSQQSG